MGETAFAERLRSAMDTAHVKQADLIRRAAAQGKKLG